MSGPAGSRRLVSAALACLVAATVALWVATGDPAVALAPLLAAALGWAFLKVPFHRTALLVFFLAIVADNPKEHPAQGRWSSPLAPLGVLLYENLNNITGVAALRFCVMDLLLAALFVMALVRERPKGAVPPPPALHALAAVAWVAVVWLELFGLARGGDFKASLWQARQLFWTPAIVAIFAAALRGPADHGALGKVVITAALLKAAAGVYYTQVICPRLGLVPDYATTHSDTVLFVTAAVAAAALWLEERTATAALICSAILAAVGAGILVNDRRLAFVSLGGAVAMLRFVLPPDGLRRTFDRLLVAAVPATIVYLAIGWRSGSAFFGPARTVASLFSPADLSSSMRDIENFNLVVTWKQNPLLGMGLGHEYKELVQPAWLEALFPLYRYIGHNGILWLGAAGGVVGFTAFWMLPAALAFFAARAYAFSAAPLDRAAALTALSVTTTIGVQAFGDMGLNSWTVVFFLAVGLAVASKLAVASGAYPGPRSDRRASPARAAPSTSPHGGATCSLSTSSS